MLKITPGNGTGEGLGQILRLEGKLVGPWVGELLRVCEEQRPTGSSLRLDLSAVTFVDGAGLNLLRSLRARGVGLDCCSGLVAELLRRENR